MTYDTIVITEPESHVVQVMLNRPEARNAFNTKMAEELVWFFEDVGLNPREPRAIVLTGAGDKAFCAGGDLKERRGMTDDQWRRQHLIFERMARAILFCPVPVIGAVNGAAYGGGCEIAGACDFLYSADTARFALTEVTLGIIPGAGGTQTLARAIGNQRAKELILSGQSFSAEEAERWGFVNRVFPAERLLAEAIATARRIATNAPIAVRQAKQAISRGSEMSISQGLAFEIEAYNRTIVTKDRREGIDAFNEKRPARFTGE